MERDEVMTDQEIKEACKFVIENGNRDFTDAEKKILKDVVDNSRNLQELLTAAIVSLGMGRK